MAKSPTGWHFFERFQSQLAIFGNETPRRGMARWFLVVSCVRTGYCVLKYGRFQPLSAPANRAVEAPGGASSSIAMSYFPAR